jgi:aspartyl-tRNA(Asn)/glutamyl-tRNA(Gln) amidotransferase subunit A
MNQLPSLYDAILNIGRKELVQDTYSKIIKRNRLFHKPLNAFIADDFVDATNKEGILCALPISIKANISAKGCTFCAGSKMLQDFKSPYNSTIVDRLLDHGARIDGVTNMDEFGMGSSTSFSTYGPTFNSFSLPWLLFSHSFNSSSTPPTHNSLDDIFQRYRGLSYLSPGGSSGGSAVSVATGSAFASIGSDTGGSIRLPANFNGLVGFKPSYGSIPRHGLISYASSLDTVGFLTKSVTDSYLLSQLTHGYSSLDDTSIRHDEKNEWKKEEDNTKLLSLIDSFHASSIKNQLKGIRIGVPIEYGFDLSDIPSVSRSDLHLSIDKSDGENASSSLDPFVKHTWKEAIKYVQDLGAIVKFVSLPDTILALPCYYTIASAEAASNLSRYDGIRYGYRSDEIAASNANSNQTNAAFDLHELYTRTRSEAFGDEVKKRILIGNAVLSASQRKHYYDAAINLRMKIKSDFTNVFQTEQIDCLLTPVCPSLPWRVSKNDSPIDSNNEYLQDVMTVPSSLAGLPSIALPFLSAKHPCFDQFIKENSSNPFENTPQVPTGIQLIGKYRDDTRLLQISRIFENGK